MSVLTADVPSWSFAGDDGVRPTATAELPPASWSMFLVDVPATAGTRATGAEAARS